MEDSSIEHGPLEFLFTVDEEIGMEGAQGLEWEVPSPAPYHTFDTPPVVK